MNLKKLIRIAESIPQLAATDLSKVVFGTPESDKLKAKVLRAQRAMERGFTATIKMYEHTVHLYINQKVVSAKMDGYHNQLRSVAKCHPDDKYDVKRGIVVALTRLFRMNQMQENAVLSKRVQDSYHDYGVLVDKLVSLDKQAVEEFCKERK